MALQFTVLASGSAGNASLLAAGGFRLLLDAGLGPRQLASRLAKAGTSWPQVQAVLLTHTHSDHWNDRTFTYLYRLRVPLYCHAEHHPMLSAYSPAFARLRADQLVRTYEAGQDLELAPTLRCRPLPLRHDGAMTCGFRFEGPADFFGQPCALGYAADLGCWGQELAQALGDVDLLALEFNHDVILEETSGRSPALIFRVLGDRGHLSNTQAAGLLREVLKRSQPGRLRHLVQLHLSRQCNRPAIAVDAARVVLRELNADLAIHTARQDRVGPSLTVGNGAAGLRRPVYRRPARPAVVPSFLQPLLWDVIAS